MKLLIVDDHGPTREMIRQMIGPLALEVWECAGGAEAVRACADFCPNVVTLDLHMMPMTGFEAMRQILAGQPRAHVIVVTQDADAGLRQLSLRSGASWFVTKDNLAGLRSFMETNREILLNPASLRS